MLSKEKGYKDNSSGCKGEGESSTHSSLPVLH